MGQPPGAQLHTGTQGAEEGQPQQAPKPSASPGRKGRPATCLRPRFSLAHPQVSPASSPSGALLSVFRVPWGLSFLWSVFNKHSVSTSQGRACAVRRHPTAPRLGLPSGLRSPAGRAVWVLLSGPPDRGPRRTSVSPQDRGASRCRGSGAWAPRLPWQGPGLDSACSCSDPRINAPPPAVLEHTHQENRASPVKP